MASKIHNFINYILLLVLLLLLGTSFSDSKMESAKYLCLASKLFNGRNRHCTILSEIFF